VDVAPVEPVVRGDRLYARGASDDKGNFLPLLHVACGLARAGELPVNVRVLMEGEEEIGGHSVVDWIAGDERGADCAIVFDGSMLDERTPALTLGVRGIVQVIVDVHTGQRNLHSGLYGGAVLNAAHVLQRMLGEVLPGPDGRLRAELRAGIAPAGEAERASWSSQPPGDAVLAEEGGRPVVPDAGREFYARTWADASLDLNGLETGDARQPRTIIPAHARAIFSMRLAAGQDSDTAFATLERLMRAVLPAGADVQIVRHGAGEPAAFDPGQPALALAREALRRACGVEPALQRSGGSIAALAAFAARGIPTILSGFALAADSVHAPDESFRLESLRLGERSSQELYAALATLR
jgi:acetylornithine deacetylase/succinyl-diaminopimelate desuccinylase-like protein